MQTKTADNSGCYSAGSRFGQVSKREISEGDYTMFSEPDKRGLSVRLVAGLAPSVGQPEWIHLSGNVIPSCDGK